MTTATPRRRRRATPPPERYDPGQALTRLRALIGKHTAAAPAMFGPEDVLRHITAQVTAGADVDVQTCLDALAQLPTVRDELERRELLLIICLRAAKAGWQQIGVVLGHRAKYAKQNALNRYTALAGRYPDLLTANARPAACGEQPGCSCNPDPDLFRPAAGCDRCPTCASQPVTSPTTAP